VETIPRHKDFPRALGGRKPALPAEYLALREVRAPPLPARCPRRHRAGRACASHQRERLGSSASPASPPPLATQCVERGRSASHWTPGRQAAARRNFPRCASVVRWSCTLSAAGGEQRGRLVAVHAPEPLEERAWMPNGQLCAAQKLYTYYLPELERTPGAYSHRRPPAGMRSSLPRPRAARSARRRHIRRHPGPRQSPFEQRSCSGIAGLGQGWGFQQSARA